MKIAQVTKRVFLFVVVNILVMITVTFILGVLRVGNYFPQGGLAGLAVLCLVWGFAGALISLARSRALVAVSSGLLQRMGSREVEGVLGHEITHVANGDMVTMTLVQGVINAFVLFLSRVLAFALSQALRSRDDRDTGGGALQFL